MIQYIKNLLPRLHKYSQDLDVIEVFVDKPWVYIDFTGNHHEYVFMRDGRLLMSLNGTVTEGKWELLPTKRLLINRIVDQVMLNKMFINQDILMLQKNGTEDDPFILINQNEINDLDYLCYFKRLEEKLIIEEEEANISPRITKNKMVAGSDLKIGLVLYTENDVLMTGTYRHLSIKNKFFEIINNEIKQIYYIAEYKCKINGNLGVLKLKVANLGWVVKGDIILDQGNLELPFYEKFEITDVNNSSMKIKIDTELTIVHSSDIEMNRILIFFLVFICILLLALI